MSGQIVLVLGSGVSGLSNAIELLQQDNQVTIWSNEPVGQFPHTSASAYAMWWPVRIDNDDRIEKWANETFRHFRNIWTQNCGIALKKIFSLKMTQEKNEPWFAYLPGFRHPRAGEISQPYKDAYVLDDAPVIDPSKYLPWLRNKVVALGGKFFQNHVERFSDIPKDFSVIVNCTGLGSRELARDKTLYPSRLQTVTIKQTGLDHLVFDDEGPNKRACVVPHKDYIRLGACFDEGDESLEVDDESTLDILERCSRIVPGGLGATINDVITVSRALRPERSSVRVEVEKLPDGRVIFHDYGHDGMGYILSHGIAMHVANQIRDLA